MKEPLKAAIPLINQVALERLAAETQYDVAFPKSIAIAFGVAATFLILVGAQVFGPVGAFLAMGLNAAVIAAVTKWRAP